MERTWLILGRVVRVVVQAQVQQGAVGEAEDAAQAQAEHAAAAEQAAVGEAEDAAAQAQAEHAAVAEQAAVGEAEDAAAQAQAEHAAAAEQAAVGEAEDAAAQAQAEHAAVAEQAAVEEAEDAAARAELEQRVVSLDVPLGEPGFTISVAPPPQVTFLTAHGNSQPKDEARDMYPYIIATGPFCLLAHLGTGGNSGTDFRRLLTGTRERRNRHLVLVRYFRRADGQITAAAVRAPARPWIGVTHLRNIESISLVCDGYNYRITELIVDTGRTTPRLDLAIFRSDQSRWFAVELKSPLVDWDPHRKWVPHGAVAVGRKVMWFDLSWGVLSCDVIQERPEDYEAVFYRLPRGRALPKGRATEDKDIHRRRCIAVSGDLLRYVEIIPDPILDPNGEAEAVSMWSLQMDDDRGRMRWIANYRVSFQEIWNDASYAETGMAQEVPVLAAVCPANPDVVYFDLQQRLFGVNFPEHRVVEYEANQHELVNVPGVPHPQTGSSRYLVTWNLLRPGTGRIIGYVSPDLTEDDFPDEKDEEPQDQDRKGKSKAMGGRRKSTSGSSGPRTKALRIK